MSFGINEGCSEVGVIVGICDPEENSIVGAELVKSVVEEIDGSIEGPIVTTGLRDCEGSLVGSSDNSTGV